MRLFYSALWWLVLPLALLRLWWRGRAEPGYRRHIAERFGIYGTDAAPMDRPLETAAVALSAQATSSPAFPTGPIWLHAVSVGETRAAQPLIDALLARHPERSLLLTHMTATGRATGAELFGHYGARLVQAYLPYDTGWFAARFLQHFKPCISILMETEVWPNMIAQCRRHGVPVALVNARLSARSMRRGMRLGGIMQQAAAGIGLVAAQTAADADRLLQFGAPNVHVTGSIKFDVAPPEAMVARGTAWRERVGTRPVLLCASTRDGEEELILAALKKMLEAPAHGSASMSALASATAAARAAVLKDLLVVIVPRHPQRFDAVAASIAKTFGIDVASVPRRSVWKEAEPSVRVVLGDSMGEMFAYYAACDVAYIGGSLLPLGGQNLIEAALLGKPVLIGPHTFNFAQSSNDAVAAGAAVRVPDAETMLAAAVDLLADPLRLEDAGKSALAFAQQHQGATGRTVLLLDGLLDS